MARVVTAAELLTDTRDRADVDASTGRPTDAQLLKLINRAVARLWGKIAAVNDKWLPKRSGVLTIDGASTEPVGQDWILPTDCLWPLYVVGAGNLQTRGPLPRVDFDTFLQRRYARSPVFEATAWTVDGTSVRFVPVVPATPAPTIWYVPVPALLVTGAPAAGEANSIELYNYWDDFVVAWAAIRVKLKDEDSIDDATIDLQAGWETILTEISHRARGEPERVVDRMGRFRRGQYFQPPR